MKITTGTEMLNVHRIILTNDEADRVVSELAPLATGRSPLLYLLEQRLKASIAQRVAATTGAKPK